MGLVALCVRKKNTKLTTLPFSICVYLGRSLRSCEPICKIARVIITTTTIIIMPAKLGDCKAQRIQRYESPQHSSWDLVNT